MKTALIIGAGPAGLAAAYELVKKSDIKPIIIERDSQVGGLAKTIVYKGNRLDIGPHRFFSRLKRVNDLWQEILPLATKSTDPKKEFLRVKRLTRILFLKKFFNYPVSLNTETLKNLGFKRIVKIFFSYLKIKLWPLKTEQSLEDFFTNRFGRELYLTFFKDYTEKVWGVNCSQIPRDWGVQRVKDLSVTKALIHFLKKILKLNLATETTLVEEFFYPAQGAGQMYEEMARQISAAGGQIYLGQTVIGLAQENKQIKAVRLKNSDNLPSEIKADYFLSSMPIQDLLWQLDGTSLEIKAIGDGLVYRDYIIIGLLFKKMLKNSQTKDSSGLNIIPDNWVYVQELEIKMGRLDIFNNFSPQLLNDSKTVWLGAEYFCQVGDELWEKSDSALKDLALEELIKINLVAPEDLLDYLVIRVPQAYPAYFGTYDRFAQIKNYVDGFANLFLIGRNGAHCYNNMDHSILAGLTAADNIINNNPDKSNLWAINTEEEYHEKGV